MEEWKEYKLGEIGTIVGGATPSTKISSNYDGDIAWITPKDLSDHTGMYIDRGERMITREGFESCSCKMLPKGSVLFSSRAPIGYVAIASNDLCTNQGFKSVVPDKEKINNIFLFYLLIYNKNFIEGFGSGTTFKEVSGQTMKNIVVRIPSLSTQNTIASILKSLDDKIENNRRINENLEQQAQALFKSWFVDFEPFRNQPFVESELGMIPQGWRVVELGEVIKSIKDKVGSRNDVKVLSPVTTGELVLSEEYFTKQVFSESISKYIIVAPNDFAYNPARINIGSLGINNFDFDGCVSPVYVVLRCEKGYEHFFNYLRKRDSFKIEVNSRAIGGVRQTLNYKDFSLIQSVYPPKDVVCDFNSFINKYQSTISNLEKENIKLAELRDTLLPRLMSGELKVNDVENKI